MPPKKKTETKIEKEEKPKRKYTRKKKEEVISDENSEKKLEKKSETKLEKNLDSNTNELKEVHDDKLKQIDDDELKEINDDELRENNDDELIELNNFKNENELVFTNEKKKGIVYNKNKFKSVSFFKFSDYLNSEKKLSECDTVDLLRCAIARAHVDNQLQLKNVLFQTLKASKLECEFPLTADSKYKNYFKNKQFNKEKKNFY